MVGKRLEREPKVASEKNFLGMRACLFRRRIFGRYQKVLHGGQQGNTHP
jgi:hypothetical protein